MQPIKLVITSFALSLFACATDEVANPDGYGSGGGKADGERLSAHARAVRTCDRARAADQREGDAARLAKAKTFYSCVKTANAVAADVIDAVIPAETIDYASLPFIETYQETAEAACITLSKTSPLDVRPMVLQECFGLRERHLAALIDGYVAFPSSDRLNPSPAAFDFFADCYDAYWPRKRSATTADAQINVEIEMSECIAQVSGQRAGYLRTLLEAGGMPDEQAEDLVSQLFERTEEAQVSICSILSAGSGKTGRAGDVVNAECNSVASAQVGTAVYQAISPE